MPIIEYTEFDYIKNYIKYYCKINYIENYNKLYKPKFYESKIHFYVDLMNIIEELSTWDYLKILNLYCNLIYEENKIEYSIYYMDI